MRYFGKVLGALLGWLLMRHPIGLLIGGLLGHAFDAGWLGLRPPRSPMDEAYRTLGVSEDASDAEIERAYRQLMGKYHPDKAAGAPEEIRARAEERARAINTAYDRVRQLRRYRR